MRTSRVDILRNQLVTDIAKILGAEALAPGFDKHSLDVRYIQMPSGLKLLIMFEYSRRSDSTDTKIEVSACWPRHVDGRDLAERYTSLRSAVPGVELKPINISLGKSPSVIAKDIQRRLLTTAERLYPTVVAWCEDWRKYWEQTVADEKKLNAAFHGLQLYIDSAEGGHAYLRGYVPVDVALEIAELLKRSKCT